MDFLATLPPAAETDTLAAPPKDIHSYMTKVADGEYVLRFKRNNINSSCPIGTINYELKEFLDTHRKRLHKLTLDFTAPGTETPIDPIRSDFWDMLGRTLKHTPRKVAIHLDNLPETSKEYIETARSAYLLRKVLDTHRERPHAHSATR
jgi:hypothetical protein